MASFIVVSDAPPEEWQNFMTEIMEAAAGKKVQGVAVVVLLDKTEENSALMGYHNMSTEDKAAAAAHIQADVVNDIAKENIGEWIAQMEEEGEDDPNE